MGLKSYLKRKVIPQKPKPQEPKAVSEPLATATQEDVEGPDIDWRDEGTFGV